VQYDSCSSTASNTSPVEDTRGLSPVRAELPHNLCLVMGRLTRNDEAHLHMLHMARRIPPVGPGLRQVSKAPPTLPVEFQRRGSGGSSTTSADPRPNPARHRGSRRLASCHPFSPSRHPRGEDYWHQWQQQLALPSARKCTSATSSTA
jgi:hypothetical protein